jgi:hypothetical protein
VFTGASRYHAGQAAGEPAYLVRVASLGRTPVRTFARTFAAETGMTPGQCVGRVRLEAARRLLDDTGDGIEQVARRCGYRAGRWQRDADGSGVPAGALSQCAQGLDRCRRVVGLVHG